MSSQKLEIVYGFFCEFVRLEMSGQVTPIGIWGDTCKIAAAAPFVLPAMAFHAYIRNPSHQPYNAKIRITIPGKATPAEVVVPVKGENLQEGQNLNFNMTVVRIPEPGDVVVQLQLDTEPPTEREFRLHMDFQPIPTRKAPKPTSKRSKG